MGKLNKKLKSEGLAKSRKTFVADKKIVRVNMGDISVKRLSNLSRINLKPGDVIDDMQGEAIGHFGSTL